MPSSWVSLTHPPTFNISTMLLLLDGTVFAHESGSRNWWQLVPDPHGRYINGTWSTRAPMHHTRLYYASAVLNDGRVLVAGGEYSDAGADTNTAEIYDPLADTWTEIPAPAGWDKIGDAPSAVVPDGRLLLGQIDGKATGLWNPVTAAWAAGPQKGDVSSEESWVLMPDGSVVTVQCTAHPAAEKYLSTTSTWVSAGQTPVDLVETGSIEIGAGILLPDGRALFIGATPHTALYSAPAQSGDPGSWTRGPNIPNDAKGKTCGAKDAPACLMTNGHVLLTVGPVDGVSGDYLGPTYFYEFDGQNLAKVPDAPNAGSFPYVGRMLLLPTGEVLYASGTQALYAYSAPSGGINNAWRPTITSVPQALEAGFSFTLTGTQLNGLSQAVGYGDDAQAATNYPLVRLTNAKGSVYYCRTFGHSTMAVATGAAAVTTNFFIPFGVPQGSYDLAVVANGIPSQTVKVSVAPFHLHIDWPALWLWLIGNLADGPLWVLGPHGPIPVDPWGPRYVNAAQGARRAILDGFKTLQQLGRQVNADRLSVARQAPPAVDPALPEWARPRTPTYRGKVGKTAQKLLKKSTLRKKSKRTRKSRSHK